MMKKRNAFIFAFLSGAILLSAETFEYRYEPGKRYEVATEIAEDVYKNGEFSHTARLLIMEWLHIVAEKPNYYLIGGDYSVSESTASLDVAYEQKKEYRNNLFKLTKNGEFIGDRDNFMPVKRNFPLFKGEVQRNQPWFSAAAEVHDFRGELFGIEYPYRVPSSVVWEYKGLSPLGKESFQKINGRLSVSYQPNPVDSLYRRYPIAVNGYSDVTLYWNPRLSLLHQTDETFDISFTVSDGQVFRYKGKSHAQYQKMEPIDKNRFNELAELMKIRFGEEIFFDFGDGWVRITLNNIHFGPEDYQLTPEESEKLSAIAAELKHHKGRFIRVVGHTAMAGTESGRNRLSQQRANVVRDYLIRVGAAEANRVSAEGKGAREPVNRATTQEAMKQNRRVEIYIMVGN